MMCRFIDDILNSYRGLKPQKRMEKQKYAGIYMHMHRDGERAEKTETRALEELVERLIEEHGVRCFLCGMEQGLELAFGEAAARLRDSKYPFVTLESVIPYEEQAVGWSEPQRDRYYDLAARCDEEHMLKRGYVRGCITERDVYLLGRSRYLILMDENEIKALVMDRPEL